MIYFNKRLALLAKKHKLFDFYRELTYFLLVNYSRDKTETDDLIELITCGNMYGGCTVSDSSFIDFLKNLNKEVKKNRKTLKHSHLT